MNWSKKFSNPYLIRFFIGLRGVGKTTLATKYGIQHLKLGHQVYANFNLFGAYKIDLDQFSFYNVPPESAIFLDEASLLFSNRDFKTFKKEYEEYFRLSRKRHVYIYLFSQSFDVDKKIRDIVDEIYIVKKMFNVLTVAKRVNRSIVLHVSENEDGSSNNSENFITEDYKYSSPFSWTYAFIPRWIKFFNSFECPDLPPIQKDKYIFDNEAYLHKLKYYSFYKKDQFNDFVEYLKLKYHSYKISFDVDLYYDLLDFKPLEFPYSVIKKPKMIDYINYCKCCLNDLKMAHIEN